MEVLTKQEKKFVEGIIETGNQTQSAKKAFGLKSNDYAGKKGSLKVREGKIQNALQTFADRIQDDKLFKVLDEGLEATKMQGVGGMAINMKGGDVESMGHTDMVVADYAVRHKYLETGLKVKSYFPKDGNQTNVQININRFKEYE